MKIAGDSGVGHAEHRPFNHLLRRLSAADFALLAPHVERVRGEAGEVLYNAGDDVAVVHFPCAASLATFIVANEDGREVETALVGREGAIGGIISHGHLPAFARIGVKLGGPFVRVRAGALEEAKERSPTLRRIFARYADCLLAQIMQAVACNAVHSIEQRAAKFVISALERTGDPVVALTHEKLAALLGVGRSYTSRVIQTFRAEGLLETRRGAVAIRDVEALQARACRCNDAVRNHFETVLSGVYPPQPARTRVPAGGGR